MMRSLVPIVAALACAVLLAPAAEAWRANLGADAGFVPAQAQDTMRLRLDRSKIALRRGERMELRVSRRDARLGRVQLGLIPSRGSNLLASGGMFELGALETVVAVEAPSNAHSGTVTVFAKGRMLVLAVTVRD